MNIDIISLNTLFVYFIDIGVEKSESQNFTLEDDNVDIIRGIRFCG